MNRYDSNEYELAGLNEMHNNLKSSNNASNSSSRQASPSAGVVKKLNMPLIRSARCSSSDNQNINHVNSNNRSDCVFGFSEVSFKVKKDQSVDESINSNKTQNYCPTRLRSNYKVSTPPSPLLAEQNISRTNSRTASPKNQPPPPNNVTSNNDKTLTTISSSSLLANFRSNSPFNNQNRMNSTSSINSNEINEYQQNIINNNNLNPNYNDAFLTPNCSRKNSINDVDSGIDSSIKSAQSIDRNHHQMTRNNSQKAGVSTRNYDVTNSCDLTLPKYEPMSNDNVDLARVLEDMKSASLSNNTSTNEKIIEKQGSFRNKMKANEPIINENDKQAHQNASLGELQVKC
jgi:hypothetical protein